MSDFDYRRLSIRDEGDAWLCPSCGFAGYFQGTSFDREGPLVGTGICPCCMFEPGFDDIAAASGTSHAVPITALSDYARVWRESGMRWKGTAVHKPKDWNPETQAAQWDRLVAPILETRPTLKRPVWNMLNGRQTRLAVATGAAVRIDPRYGPFAAAIDRSDDALLALAATLRGSDDAIALVEAEPWPLPPRTQVIRTGELLQMVCEGPCSVESDDRIIQLDEPDAAAMAELALATEPGPWGSLTHRYGTFYGIRVDGRLAAMAGERMLLPGLAEVSGVCTWPEFRGQGMAAALIRRVMAGFVARGDTPFLHSYAHNTSAIRLYEALGFRATRPMHLTVLARA